MNILRKPFRWSYRNVTLYLIGINIAVFILQTLAGRVMFQLEGGRISFVQLLALNPILIMKYGMYWQFATYMFAHGGVSHILFNMLALFIFGRQLEQHIGSREFLLYYLLTGAAAGVLSFAFYIISGAYYVSLLGASGALFAVQLAYAAFFPNNLIYIWGILPLRAPIMVLVFTAIELFSGVFGFSSSVAHFTHLFGFAAGFVYFLIRWRANPFKMMFHSS
ncbi:MAG: rhomboid family intramembrane serine protease [Spirochaetaceae bacterium]|jgi:membrane associated rhomboid family serine protease|nr:rhomboid family intramembrane serine protease [Spirochaetaceae bacterium]